MKAGIFAILILSLALPGNLHAQEIRTYGVKVNVADLNKAADFYGKTFGFEVESKAGDYVFLKTKDKTRLVIHQVTNLLPEGNTEACAGLTLQVNDLDKTIASLKSKGVNFGSESKRKEGVGYAIYLNDPFGTKISLMHHTITKVEPFTEPQIYNYGFKIPDMTKAIQFYVTALGFVERSKNYLPNDMPLGHKDGSFGFMLHFREGTEAIRHNSTDSEHIAILFSTTDIELAIPLLKERGVQFLQKGSPIETPLGKSISFYDPFGYLSELIEVN